MKRVLLIEDLPQVAEHLKGMLGREQEVELAGVQTTAEAGITQASTEKPDVVLIDALLQGKVSPFEAAKRIRAASPGTRIVMITVPQKPIEPRIEDGVDGVFTLPGGANELAQVLGAGKDAKKDGKGQVVAVYSAKGGTGKTTIAVNLACVLRRNGAAVALLDGVMQFGSVRHLFAVPPSTRSMVDLPAGAAMRAAIGEATWEGPGGITVLLAPPRPEEADLVSPSELPNAIGLLASNHDYVVVDTHPKLSDDTLGILDAANVILLVVTYMNATLANTVAAISTFEALGYRGQKPILLVVNQADATAGLTKAALEHQLNLPVIAEIPSDFRTVGEANNKSNPFVLANPQAAVSQAINALATSLVTQQRK